MASLDRTARQIILLLVDRTLGLPQPIGRCSFVLFHFFFKHMLIGNGNSYLRFQLQKLVFHVEQNLFD